MSGPSVVCQVREAADIVDRPHLGGGGRLEVVGVGLVTGFPTGGQQPGQFLNGGEEFVGDVVVEKRAVLPKLSTPYSYVMLRSTPPM